MAIEEAIDFLKEAGFKDAFELSGILVIPVSSPLELADKASEVGKILYEAGYNKSWMLNPYHHEERNEENYEYTESR